MSTDRRTLNLAAAVLCGVGSFVATLSALFAGKPRDATARAAILSGLFGVIGSAAWAASALQDLTEARAEASDAATGLAADAGAAATA